MSPTIAEAIQPIFIESYRIIVVDRRDRFNLPFDYFGLSEFLFFIALALIIICKFLINWHFLSLKNEIFQGNNKTLVRISRSRSLGKSQFISSKLKSFIILLVLLVFLVIITLVIQSGTIISLLSMSPPVKFRTFNSVERSGIPILYSEYDAKDDVNGYFESIG